MSKQTTAPSEPIRYARKLGTGKRLILGIQHMFAMFGATILVPIITGPVSYTHLVWAQTCCRKSPCFPSGMNPPGRNKKQQGKGMTA